MSTQKTALTDTLPAVEPNAPLKKNGTDTIETGEEENETPPVEKTEEGTPKPFKPGGYK